MTGPANGPVKVSCPFCGETFPVPTELLGVDDANNQVIVRMDRSQLYGHQNECARKHPTPELNHSPAEVTAIMHQPVGPEPTKMEIAGRITQFLRGHHFMARGGSRACSMCGTKGDACLSGLRRDGTPCCGICGDGNTHPAPGEAEGSCAQWSAAQA